MQLTERKIEKLSPSSGKKDRLIFDDVQRGLAIRVTESGGRTYLVQYTLNGKKWRVPLGAFSAMPLSTAREAAAVVMGEVAKGQNPAVQRKEAVEAERAQKARDDLTVEKLISDWERHHLIQRRPRYAIEAPRALRRAFHDYLDKPAADLDRATIIRLLDGLIRSSKDSKSEKTEIKGLSIAQRTAAYGKAAFGWAKTRGVIGPNPFSGMPTSGSGQGRERVLSDVELAAVWHDAEKDEGAYRTILKLLVLTGQRREEVAGLTWAEISEDLATWTIPKERTKNGLEHIVPLSGAAQNILRERLPDDTRLQEIEIKALRNQSSLVMPGQRLTVFSGWSKSKKELDARIGFTDWQHHDLRRTLATGLQRLGVRLEVTEAILNHVSGSRSGIVGIYQRHDWAVEKRDALEQWANFVLKLP